MTVRADAGSERATAESERPADLLFVRGAVRTMEPARRTATAVAVRDGRVAAVGTDDELRPLAAPATRVVDLEGRSLLPGFQDAHVHPPLGGWALLTCDLHDLPWDREAYLAAIAGYAAAHPDETLDRRRRVGDAGAFPGGTPSRADLDAIVPDRPVFLENRDGHGAWVNSRALAVAGVTAATPDPDGRPHRAGGRRHPAGDAPRRGRRPRPAPSPAVTSTRCPAG